VARQIGHVVCDRRSDGAVYWLIDPRIGGRRYRLRGLQTRGGKWIRFRDEASAEDGLEEIRADIRRGLSPLQAISDFLPMGAPETLFDRHYRRFLEAKRRQGRPGRGRQLSAKRLDELEGHLRRGHLDPLAKTSIQAITYGVLEDWRDALLDRGLAPKTVRNIVADVGTCLRWLRKRGDLEAIPELPEVSVPEYAPRIPTPAAQDRILKAIPWPKRGAFLARGYMGLRPSEAARANVDDYDFERSLLTVHGKGGRVRYLPADSEVARWIHEHHEPPALLRDASAPLSPLFPNPDAVGPGKRWTPASARRVMLAAMKATKVRFKPNEALRHAFGTGAANRGVPLERVGSYLGHTDTRTTRRYAKLAGESLSDVPRHRPRPLDREAE
jgi:integrase